MKGDRAGTERGREAWHWPWPEAWHRAWHRAWPEAWHRAWPEASPPQSLRVDIIPD